LLSELRWIRQTSKLQIRHNDIKQDEVRFPPDKAKAVFAAGGELTSTNPAIKYVNGLQKKIAVIDNQYLFLNNPTAFTAFTYIVIISKY
jgi:hypothetical protein